MIEEILPRRSRLRRPRAFKRDQIVCANVDRIVLVVAALDPDYKRNFIDRVLVAIEREELSALIVFNKIDLADDGYRAVVEDDARVYRRLGYATLLASATTGEGIDALRAELRGKISAITGPSGVGKSTLLNALEPGLELKTQEVSEASGRGRHTTTAAQLVKLRGGGYVADTPGIRGFGLWDVGARELARCFPEFRALAARCRFGDCSHRSEPDCAVLQSMREAAETESVEPEIDEERYDSYVKLRAELEAEEAASKAAKKR